MWGKIVQTIWCKGCHMKHLYPACVACEYKAEFDITNAVVWKAWEGFYTPSPLFLNMFQKTPIFKHPSRWREEHYSGNTIRVPLLYG